MNHAVQAVLENYLFYLSDWSQDGSGIFRATVTQTAWFFPFKHFSPPYSYSLLYFPSTFLTTYYTAP